MSDDVAEKDGSGSLGKKLIALGLVILAALFLIVGGFFALIMGVLASAAGAVDEGAVPCTASSLGGGSIASVSTASSTSPESSTLPDSLEIPYGSRGGSVTLEASQLKIAARIISVGRQTNVPDRGLKIALMTALQESALQMYANETVPESLEYPHDAVGNDHDSVGPFQQRPSSGWGTVAELMDLTYSIRAFFGGPEGPNGGSPRGLLDIDDWESMEPGEAAQAVQVSAKPDAYNNWEAAADKLMSELGAGGTGCGGGGGGGVVDGEIVLPLKSDYSRTSGYGPRNTGIAGASTWHAAIDLQRWPDPCGDPVYAVLPGTVVLSSALWLSIEHEDGFVVSYLHMHKNERLVDVGDTVAAGQQIGVVGNVQPSSGCHLDLRINVANNTNSDVATLVLSQNETRIAPAEETWNFNFVNPEEFFALWGVDLCPTGSCK